MLSKEEQRAIDARGPGHADGRRAAALLAARSAAPRTDHDKPQRAEAAGRGAGALPRRGRPPGLMELRCAHRNVALDYGRVEGDCIRCPYHGWLYDPHRPVRRAARRARREHLQGPHQAEGLPDPGVRRAGVRATSAPSRRRCCRCYDVLRMEDGVKTVQVADRSTPTGSTTSRTSSTSATSPGCTATPSRPTAAARSPTTGSARTSARTTSCWSTASTTTHVSCYGFPTVNRFALPPVEPGGELVRSMIYRVPMDDASTLLYFVRFYPSEQPALQHLGARRDSSASTRRSRATGGASTSTTRTAWWSSSRACITDRRARAPGRLRRRHHPGAPDDARRAGRRRGGPGPAGHHPRPRAAVRRLPAEVRP